MGRSNRAKSVVKVSMLDKIISDTLRIKIEAQILKAKQESFGEGFALGREAMGLQLRETGRVGHIQDTHTVSCPSCKKTVKIPCINFIYEEQSNE